MNTHLATKNSYDVKFRVNRSIFTKLSILLVDLEIGYIRVFDERNANKLMKIHTLFNSDFKIEAVAVFYVRNPNIAIQNSYDV